MTSRIVFTDPVSGDGLEVVEFGSLIEDETYNARELISRALGLDADPAELLAHLERDAVFRRAVLEMVSLDVFRGMHGGEIDIIAGEVVARAKGLCLVVEARIAAEAAVKGCSQ